jgi:predicted transcriptional regulator
MGDTNLQHKPVESFMTTHVHSITTEMTLNDAIGLFLKYKISGAPVIDTMSKVISVITESDLMKLAPAHGMTKKVGQCLSHLCKPENVITMKKSATFAELYKTFLTKKVHRVVIADDSGRLQGLVTRSTVLQMVYGTPAESAEPKATEPKPEAKAEPKKAS